jgi:hypothetical protein
MAAAYEPPLSDDRGPLVIRPSWRALGRWDLHIGILIALGLVGGCINMYARYRSIGWTLALAGAGGLIFALYGMYQALYMLGTRITVTADSMLVTHWFGSTKPVACRDIARVVRISLVSDQKRAIPRPAVFAFSAAGRCVMSLYAERWSTADLDRIWHQLGITPEGSWDNTIVEDNLAGEFPGAF